MFAAAATNSSLVGGGGIQTVQFSAVDDLVTLSGTFGAGSVFGGSGNDTLVFANGAVFGATSVLKLDAGDDSLVFQGNTLSGQFGGGLGNDAFSGSVTVGQSGVSFWGGVGNDTFNFTTITNSGNGGTAYFWNEGGTDSLVFGSLVSSSSQQGAIARFGITVGASLDISFAGTQNVTSAYGGGTLSSAFTVATNLVTFGSSASGTTLVFAGGEIITLRGAVGTISSATITNAFSNATLGTSGTANFGIAGSIPTFS